MKTILYMLFEPKIISQHSRSVSLTIWRTTVVKAINAEYLSFCCWHLL